MTLYTLTCSNVGNLILEPFSDQRRVKVWIETNIDENVIIDSASVANSLRLGTAKATWTGTDSFEFADLVPTNGVVNPTGFQYRVWIDYSLSYGDASPRGGGKAGRGLWNSGWFSFTADAELADVVAEQYVPPTWMTTATETLQGYVTQAEAARDDAIDISGIAIDDDIVEALAKNTGGVGPKTSAFLSDTYGRGVSVLSAGATGDGATDDSAAIRSAAATAAAIGADLYFPEGTYLVSRVDVGTAYALAVPAGARWHGAGTIKLKAAQANFTRILYPGAGAVIEGLTLDGNGANQGASTDQRHGVFVEAAKVKVLGCTIHDCDGDGITLNAGADDAQILSNTIHGNFRSGISIVGTAASPDISHNLIYGNLATPIDSELNSGTCDGARIIGNRLTAPNSADIALTLAAATGSYNDGWLVSGNDISGSVNLAGSKNARLLGNRIISSGTLVPSVEASQALGATILGNYIRKTDGTMPAILSQIQNSVTPTDLKVLGNDIESDYYAVLSKGTKGVTIVNNSCRKAVTAGAAGILIQATGPMTAVVIRGNHIKNFLSYAVQVTSSSSNTINGLVVRDNVYEDDQGVATMTSGLRFQATASLYTNVSYGDNTALGGTTLLVNDGSTSGPVSNGSNNPVRVLSSTPNIDGKTTGTTTLFTVPSGRSAVITGAIIRSTTATAVTVPPTLGIGVAAGEDDIFASTALTGFDTTSEIWRFVPASGLSTKVAAAGVIKLGIDTGATATTHTLAVDLIGYLI